MKEIVTIMFGLGLLLGLQGCGDKESEYEPAESDTPTYTAPENEEGRMGLEDKPAEGVLPYEEEKKSDNSAESEEELEPDPETEKPLEEKDLEEPGLGKPEIEDDMEL